MSMMNIEELAFPTVFCGESRPTNQQREVKVNYSDDLMKATEYSGRFEDPLHIGKMLKEIFFP